MIPAAELAAMRATVTDHLPDTGIITRGTGQTGTLDEETGLYTAATPDEIYTGAMRIRRAGGSTQAVHGDAQLTVAPYVLTVPYDAGPFVVGDEGDVVTVTVGSDPHIVDRPMRLMHPAAGSHQLDQRIELQEVDTDG